MANEQVFRLDENSPEIFEVLGLIRRAFAFMEGRIDPPSSMHRLTEETIKRQCTSGEVWTIGVPVKACVFLENKGDHLAIGKLAVDSSARRQGLAGRLIKLAEARAKARGLSALGLQTRIELTENHETFRRLGFIQVGTDTHEGFDRPTSLIMRKAV